VERRPRQKPFRVGLGARNQTESQGVRAAPGARVRHGRRGARTRAMGGKFWFDHLDLDIARKTISPALLKYYFGAVWLDWCNWFPFFKFFLNFTAEFAAIL
jgi:hypothetical protein